MEGVFFLFVLVTAVASMAEAYVKQFNEIKNRERE